MYQLKLSEDRAPFYYAVYSTYFKLLSLQGQYTYDDQVLFALAILKKHPDLAKEYQRFYEYIVIDEFQDFTPAQAELLQIVCQAQQNFLAFGDLDQAIRPETATVLEQFRYRDSCSSRRAHFLTENFRSTQEILDIANAVRNLKPWNYSDKVAQSAVRGERGEKPVLLPVDAHAFFSDDTDNNLLQAMIQEALAQVNRLPSSDMGSIALMVAKSEWFNSCENYLVQIGRPFSILNNKYLYQSHHINLILIYLRLIADRYQDKDLEQLLLHCVAPSFNIEQIKSLKLAAEDNGITLLDAINNAEFLDQVHTTQEQQEGLQQHLAIIQRFRLSSEVRDVWKAISELKEGPIAAVADQEQKAEELNDVLKELGDYTVEKALEHINRHIAFLEEHRTNTNLVLTTIDHAKSQAFDTVFLLGADLLKSKNRLYVGISRAKQRLFLLVNARASEEQIMDSLISSISPDLYSGNSWHREKAIVTSRYREKAVLEVVLLEDEIEEVTYEDFPF